MTFKEPELLTRAIIEYLSYMNRSWLYIHFNMFMGPPPSASVHSNFTVDLLFSFVKDAPDKIRFVLGFMEDPEKNKKRQKQTLGYTPEQLRPVADLLHSIQRIRRSTSAVQFEAVHASHSEHLLQKRIVTQLQDVLLRAPLNLYPNTTKINFNRLIKICRKFGRQRMLYDMNDELRARLSQDPDDLDLGGDVGGSAGRKEVRMSAFVYLLTFWHFCRLLRLYMCYK